MMAHRLGWVLSKTTECVEPVVADCRVLSGYRPIEAGQVRGVHQVAIGWEGDAERITLDFLAAVGEQAPCDRIEIAGHPGLIFTMVGGVNGDSATCGILLNAVHSIVRAGPGLKTMLDLPPVAWCGGGWST
jgi:4-hydroxy-tetrahydrodipicolinate reductase